MPYESAHALDYLSVVRRRLWWLVIPVLVALAGGVALLQVLPRQYESRATIGVSAASVSSALLNDAAVLDNEERLWALQQQLLSRDVLARVIETEGLWGGEATPAHVDRLRDRIALTVPDPVPGTNSRRLDAFVLAYTDDDPVRAQRVVDHLVTLFVDENARTREAYAKSTADFLAGELDRKQATLANIEARLRQAKESFAGSLPEQTQSNLDTLSGLRTELETRSATLTADRDRLAMIEHQIAAMESGGPDGQDAGGGAVAPDSPQGRVLDLEAQLATARGMYTDKHPEVIRLREALANARAAADTSRDAPVADRRARLRQDPAYRQLTADRDRLRLTVREHERAIAGLRQQMGEFRARVAAAPMVEQRLASVQREYDRAQAEYRDLAAKLDAAQLAQNVARNGNGEQFTELYAASLPTAPVSPVPWRVVLMSLLLGLCLGAAAALGREYLDRSVHDTHDLAGEFDVPVLGEIAHIPSA